MTTHKNIEKYEKDLISILFPIKEFHKFLSASIQSIINQTYQNIELIIIDDSNDSLVSNLINGLNDERIVYIKGYQKGLSKALNLAIENSRGLYLARMDSDDISSINRLEQQFLFMKKNEVDICGCNAYIINEDNQIIDTFISPKNQNLIIPYLVSFVPFLHGSVIINKSFLKKKSLFYDHNFKAEDKKLWMNFYNEGAKFLNIDEFLYHYRDTKNSLIHINLKKIIKEIKFSNKVFVKENLNKILSELSNNLDKYQEYSEKDKEILVKFYLNCFIITLNYKFLRILSVGRKRYILIYIIKSLLNKNN